MSDRTIRNIAFRFNENNLTDVVEKAVRDYGCDNCEHYPCEFIKDVEAFVELWFAEIEEIKFGGDGMAACYEEGSSE